MKRFYFLFLIAVLALVGCKNNENTEQNPPESNNNANDTSESKGIEVNDGILVSKLSKDIQIVRECDFMNAYEIDNGEYGPAELLQALTEIDKRSLKYGLIFWESKRVTENTCYPILKKFCIDNNIDLFTKLSISQYVPPEKDFANWVVKSTKTTYTE